MFRFVYMHVCCLNSYVLYLNCRRIDILYLNTSHNNAFICSISTVSVSTWNILANEDKQLWHHLEVYTVKYYRYAKLFVVNCDIILADYS